MVSGDRIGNQLGDDLVIALGKPPDNGRASSGMINPLLGAAKPSLKLRLIFSEIVQQASKPRRFGKANSLTELFSAMSGVDQMLTQ